MADDHVAQMAEISQAIAADILRVLELDGSEWDTYSLLAEVTDDMVKTVAFSYSDSGPPVPSEGPDNDDLLWDLRDATQGQAGRRWDVCLVKFHRDTAQLVVEFVTGEAADSWRITPETIDRLGEAMRPTAQDFDADGPTASALT